MLLEIVEIFIMITPDWLIRMLKTLALNVNEDRCKFTLTETRRIAIISFTGIYPIILITGGRNELELNACLRLYLVLGGTAKLLLGFCGVSL